MAVVMFGLARVDSGFVFGDWAAPPDPLPDGGGGVWVRVWVELDWGPLSDASVRASDWPERPNCGGMFWMDGRWPWPWKMCGCDDGPGRGCGSGSVLCCLVLKLLWDGKCNGRHRVFGSNRNLIRL